MLSDDVAAQVIRLRKAANLSREQLAARCADRGWPALTYGAIGSIETGRPRDGRRTREVTVDELVTLAAALDVSPSSLLFPLHREDELDPGRVAEALGGIRASLAQLDELRAAATRAHRRRLARAVR